MGLFDLLRKKRPAYVAPLGERVRNAVLQRFPDAAVTEVTQDEFRIEIAGHKESTMFLNNLRRLMQGSKDEEAEKVLQHFIASMVPAGGSVEPVHSIHQIVPTIKDQLFIEQAGARVSLVKEHLVADLWIVYAMDFPTQISTIKPEMLDELGVRPESLRELAIENLRNILPPVEHHGEGCWFLLSAGSDYCASLLLLDNIWNQLRASVDGDLVVSVPTRDVVLVTGSNSSEGIAAVRAWAQKAENSGAYAISQTLLRRKDGRWVALT